MRTEPTKLPALSATMVPMTFVHVGTPPPRIADVVEVDYLDDEAIAPMPAPPSRAEEK